MGAGAIRGGGPRPPRAEGSHQKQHMVVGWGTWRLKLQRSNVASSSHLPPPSPIHPGVCVGSGLTLSKSSIHSGHRLAASLNSPRRTHLLNEMPPCWISTSRETSLQQEMSKISSCKSAQTKSCVTLVKKRRKILRLHQKRGSTWSSYSPR